uniref:Uncharacterized protein n=1 Tax=Lutzomyia longipalpis TaxID=7200 RepID=A0A1B0GIP0_LUTLO
MLYTLGIHPALRGTQIKSRSLWQWINIIFNTVDKTRLRKVGPDRLCAEWVLKNGGAVRFLEHPKNLFRDYNMLPPDFRTKLTLKEIDATNSAIMTVGFAHVVGCEKIDKIIITNCKYIDNRGFHHLTSINDSLRSLDITQCTNISDSGLLQLKGLTKLQKLVMKDLPGVKDLPAVEKELRQHLKDCQFQTSHT